MWSPLRQIDRAGSQLERKRLNGLASDGPPAPEPPRERDRSWPAPSIVRIPGYSSGHREPVQPSAAPCLGMRCRRPRAGSTESSVRQPRHPRADLAPFAASALFLSSLAPPFPREASAAKPSGRAVSAARGKLCMPTMMLPRVLSVKLESTCPVDPIEWRERSRSKAAVKVNLSLLSAVQHLPALSPFWGAREMNGARPRAGRSRRRAGPRSGGGPRPRARPAPSRA